jgi:hypothetical protein
MLAFLPLTCFAQSSVVGNSTIVGNGVLTSGSAGTFTAIQTVAAATGSVNTYNLAVASTGSNHLLVIQSWTTSGAADYISSISGGCSGSWTVPAGAQTFNASIGAASSSFCILSSSGVTTITINLSATAFYAFAFYEVSDTIGHTPSLDTGVSGGLGTVSNSSSGTNPTGVALTVSGKNMGVFQQIVSTGGQFTAISGPYGNLNNFSTTQVGFADALNITTGSSPTWTNGTASTSIGAAIAFDSN